MLSIQNLSIHFSGRYLFDDVSAAIGKSDKIGLIGRNGTGKTTLLKILAGIEFQESGNVSKPNEYSIGYLPQELSTQSTKTIFEEAEAALVVIRSIEANIEHLHHEIESRTDYTSDAYMKLLERLAESNERFKVVGGHSSEAEIEKVLTGLGFERTDFSRSVAEFSGGWQMRLELAKILLERPDCILLDEPTNHLDIESIQWLENFLKSYESSVVIVSHDKNFLDNVTNRTFELSGGKIFDMPLPYSRFINAREEQRKQQANAYKNQQREIAQTERFIERFRSKANLATRVQSRVKQLDRIERIELDEEDFSSIRFTFPEAPRSARVVAEATSLTKKYDNLLVLDKINFAIEKGEKVAFVGKNGEGKSTLSRILAGMESYDGELKIGSNVSLGYFAQHQDVMLDPDATVFDIIDRAATGDMRTRIRSLLGAFLFSGDSVYKKVKVLSGGEKSRLSIARLLLQPINFLILDEPTNHLDMTSKEVLKKSLIEFTGALIVVSHDREFLRGLTQKTVHFRNKSIKEYPGDIYEFLEKQNLESLSSLEYSNAPKQSSTGQAQSPKQSQLSREEQKNARREESRLKKLITDAEKEIEKLEARKADLDAKFADPEFYADANNARTAQNEYKEISDRLDELMEVWEARQLELEEFRAN